jgi:polysaccharide pyruvyl transferase WcaK-like protein
MNDVSMAAAGADERAYAGGVALLSPSGWGNLGDEAIVNSVIHAVRLRLPEVPILGLTLNPEDTVKRHGIPAFTCTGFPVGEYSVVGEDKWWATLSRADDASLEEVTSQGTGAGAGAGTGPQVALRRLARTIPGLRATWRTVRGIRAEVRHRHLLAGATSRLRFVVVAGGGQLDDFWGGALGHPYVLWRWARRARTTGAKFLILSVGTGTLATPLARQWVRQALAHADYRSYRDEGSRRLIRDRREEGAPVVPDLAFGLPVDLHRQGAAPGGERPVVGVSPMPHCDPRVWPVRDASRYRSYLERLAAVATRLINTGHDLVLYGTDQPDALCVIDLKNEIAKHVPSESLARVTTPPVGDVRELFAALAPVRVTIASRLHGVILPHLLRIPVVALSYERKVATAMKAMGFEKYCTDIDAFGADEVFESVREVLARRSQLSNEIDRFVEGFRRQVDDQYDLVFGGAP